MENEKNLHEDAYEIVRNLGQIGKRSYAGWQKEVNVIRWNDGAPGIDIRRWKTDAEGQRLQMGKGIWLNLQESAEVAAMIENYLNTEGIQ